MTFNWADYSALGLFFLIVLLLGFSAKLRDNTALQLVAAGRRLTLPLFVATLVTTWYGGVLGMGESFGWYGLSTYTILAVPYWVFGIAFAFLMAKRVRQEEQISIPERMERCYGKTAGLISSVLVLLLATPASYILMLGILIHLIFPGVPLVTAIALGGIGGTLFLYKGGLLADARSNLIAFLMMYAAFAVILVTAIVKFGSPAEMIAKLPESHRAWDGGQGLLWVLSWLLFGSWTFVDPGFHQRVAAADSDNIARKGVLVSVFFWIIFDSLTTMTALYAYSVMPPPEDAKLLFPLFGDMLLPNGVKGIFFAGMFGAILSATAGYTFVSASTLGRDFVQRIRPSIAERQVAVYVRIGIAAATLIGIVLAVTVQSVVDLWWTVAGVIIPGLFIPVVAAYAKRGRLDGRVAVACMAGGSIGAFLWQYLTYSPWYQTANRSEWWNGLSSSGNPASLATPIIAGLVAAFVIWGIGSLITGRGERNG